MALKVDDLYNDLLSLLSVLICVFFLGILIRHIKQLCWTSEDTNHTCMLDEDSKMLIVRSAVGRLADIGYLYDAHKDYFVGEEIFKGPIPSSAIKQLLNTQKVECRWILSESYGEKFDNLDLSAALKLSILSGLVSLEGSGMYNSQLKASSKTIRSTLVYNVTTSVEQVNMDDQELRKCISNEALVNASTSATHFVFQVTRGARVFISFDYQTTDNSSKRSGEINGSAVQDSIKRIVDLAKASLNFKLSKSDEKFMKCCTLKIEGDVTLGLHDGLPQTLEEVITFIKQLPETVQGSIKGKGNPQTYVLKSITDLKRTRGIKCDLGIKLTTIDEDVIKQVVLMFDELRQAQQTMDTFYSEVMIHEDCLTEQELDPIKQMKESLNKEIVELRRQLSTVINIRCGKDTNEQLHDLIDKTKEKGTHAKVTNLLNANDLLYARIPMYNKLKENNILFVPKGRDVVEYISRQNSQTSFKNDNAYVLYGNAQPQQADIRKWYSKCEKLLEISSLYQNVQSGCGKPAILVAPFSTLPVNMVKIQRPTSMYIILHFNGEGVCRIQNSGLDEAIKFISEGWGCKKLECECWKK